MVVPSWFCKVYRCVMPTAHHSIITTFGGKTILAFRRVVHYFALLAEGFGKVGAADEGLRVLAEALAAVQQTGEQMWEAELHRLKGTLVLQARHQPPAHEGSVLHTTGRTLQTAE